MTSLIISRVESEDRYTRSHGYTYIYICRAKNKDVGDRGPDTAVKRSRREEGRKEIRGNIAPRESTENAASLGLLLLLLLAVRRIKSPVVIKVVTGDKFAGIIPLPG